MPSRCKVYPHIRDKLITLVNFIESEKNRYDRAASCTDDKHIRNSIQMLAQETSQCGNELYSHMQVLGIKHKTTATPTNGQLKETVSFDDVQNKNAGEELLRGCCESEKKLISAYRDILNEPYLPDETRIIMRGQLNGIMYSFVQVKLLRSDHA